MCCAVCNLGPAQGVNIFRMNAKGQPGLWACNDHKDHFDAVVDPEVQGVADALTVKEPPVIAVPWMPGAVLFYCGHLIATVEESGRRFWAVNLVDPGGWSFRHEFSSAEEATRAIDERLKD